MKKAAIFFISILLVAGAAAQSHSFGDTSYAKYKQFDIVGFFEDTTDGTRHYVHHWSAPGGPRPADIVQYNYTDSPDGVRVVGISAVINKNYSPIVCPMDPPEYLLLYDAMTDTFQLVAMVQWDVCDYEGRPYFDWIAESTGGKQSFLSSFGTPPPPYFSIFDMYFDEPVTVYDSFYVGGTSRVVFGQDNWEAWYFCWTLGRMDTVTNTVFLDYKPILWKTYSYDSTGITNQWYWTQTNQWMEVIPIIEVVDTSFANAPACPRVSGLFLRGNNTDTVTVQWSYDSLHTEFELSYGREGMRPEEGTIITLHDTNRWQFTDTTYRDTPMVTYVRTVCREYDTLRWSNWGSPLYWHLHHQGSNHEGIAVPDDQSDLARFVQLMPNPANNRALVISSYGIEGIEVYDVKGNRVLEQKGAERGTTAGFDVTGWAKGAYVVLVRTPAGTTAKRLVVN